ncbi:hypothetical protein PWT90_01210 [Aphanocladium album]|nr:hypothetical protein PWT90_01210 [Aphanocladium album]
MDYRISSSRRTFLNLNSTKTQSDALLDAYYENFHRFHPLVLPRHHFLTLLKDPKWAPRLETLAAILKLIGNLYVSQEWSKSLQDDVDIRMGLLTATDPIRVQCHLLYSVALFWQDQKSQFQLQMGKAVELALELKMFEKDFALAHSEQDKVLAECWRRTWWMVYLFDAFYAGTLGKMEFSVIQIDATADLPCDEAEYESGDIPEPKTLRDWECREFDEEDRPFSSFAYLIGAVKCATLAKAASLKGDPQKKPSDILHVVDSVLDSWMLLLPKSKKQVMSRNGDIDELMFQAHLLIHVVMIGFHRPLSDLKFNAVEDISSCARDPAPDGPIPEHINVHTVRVLRSVESQIRLLALPSRPFNHTPFSTCMISEGTLALLSACKFLLRGTELAIARDQIRLTIGCLKNLGALWPRTARNVSQIQTIAKHVLGIENQSLPKDTASLGHSATSGSEEAGSSSDLTSSSNSDIFSTVREFEDICGWYDIGELDSALSFWPTDPETNGVRLVFQQLNTGSTLLPVRATLGVRDSAEIHLEEKYKKEARAQKQRHQGLTVVSFAHSFHLCMMRSNKRKGASNSEPTRRPQKIAKHGASSSCTFTTLPNEIIYLIASRLSQSDLHNLCLANRLLSTLLERSLYARDAAHHYSESLLWSAIHGRPATARKAISAGAKIDGWKAKPPDHEQVHWDRVEEARRDAMHGNRARVPLSHCDQTPLFIAAYQGHVEVAKILMSHNAAPSWKTPWENFMTPASAAAAKGHMDILVHMHEIGYDLGSDRCYHGTVLHSAVVHGRAKVVEFLIKTVSLDIGERNSDGKTALELSITSQSVTVLKYLLKLTPANDVSVTAAFSQAIERYIPGYAEIILDSNKIDWTHTTRFGDTLIAQAILQDKPYFLRLLLQCESLDPSVPTVRGSTPLMLARQYPGYHGTGLELLIDSEKIEREEKLAIGKEVFFELVRRADCDTLLKKLLTENLAGDDLAAHFHSAAEHGRLRIIRLLVNEYNVPVDSQMSNGQTALKAAFLRQDTETTKCLCELGASSVLGGSDSLPMLHHAARNGPVPLMRALLKGGVDPNRTAEETSQTALHFACASGNLDRITALFDNGADPMICDVEGYTAYHFAVRAGKEKLVKWLLSGRRHPDPLLQIGPTLLHEACRAGNTPLVKLLLKRKCNIEARTSGGETALHLAAAQGHLDIIQLLVNSGADSSAQAGDGSTPESLGAKSESSVIREVFAEKMEKRAKAEQSKSLSFAGKANKSKARNMSDTPRAKGNNENQCQLRRSSRAKQGCLNLGAVPGSRATPFFPYNATQRSL